MYCANIQTSAGSVCLSTGVHTKARVQKMTKKWVPLESNPDIFNEFASKLGLDLSTYSFCDIYGLDEDMLSLVPQPVLAVLLCFPITEESEAAAKAEDAAQTGVGSNANVYYMKQTISNACGTIALLHGIGNNLDQFTFSDNSFLNEFFTATASLSPEDRGRYLESPPEGAPNIEEAHQAAAAEGDSVAPAADEDVDLHFVCFVNNDGSLYQLDGRRKGPVFHGVTTSDTFLLDVANVVRQFVERSKSISFNLLALSAGS